LLLFLIFKIKVDIQKEEEKKFKIFLKANNYTVYFAFFNLKD